MSPSALALTAWHVGLSSPCVVHPVPFAGKQPLSQIEISVSQLRMQPSFGGGVGPSPKSESQLLTSLLCCPAEPCRGRAGAAGAGGAGAAAAAGAERGGGHLRVAAPPQRRRRSDGPGCEPVACFCSPRCNLLSVSECLQSSCTFLSVFLTIFRSTQHVSAALNRAAEALSAMMYLIQH